MQLAYLYPYTHFIDYRDLEGFVKKVADRVGKPYSVFIDFDLYKSCFSLRLLGRQRQKDFSDINNLSPEEAEVLKFDQKRFIADTMALKRFYMRNLYCKDMSIEDWNNICNRKFIENFSSPESQKHFLQLSYFRRQGHNEESVMKGLKVEENIQWEFACYRAEKNLKKLQLPKAVINMLAEP
uniref:Uncharacterized protein n=1 Tax=Rhizophagus irregularis (strain DAOM 181602 / DAOM 197198 / MUCL 43194) TaxID=747089 RepID=U9SZR0_RHIID